MFGNETEYKTVDYSQGDIIFKAGDVINTLYIVKAGEVTCVSMNKDRLVPVYNVIDSGVIGEDGVFSNKRPSNYYAIAMSDVKVLEIPKADIMKFINSTSDWIKNILFNISEKVSHTTDVISEHKIIDERFNGGKLLTDKEEVLIKKSLAKK